MPKYLFTLVLSLCVSLVLAQAASPTHSDAEPHACGQVNTSEQIDFLRANNPNLNLAFRPSMDTIRVPVLFHRIADENGNGAVSEADCASALVELNALYASGRIVFEECESPRLIVDSNFYNYEYNDEFEMRQAHEVSGVINVFIPNTATTSSGGQVCGYAYLPPTRRDLTLVAKSCFTNGTTFPHEVGHFLGLYHTHGTSNCGSLTDELVDGSNCDTFGDDVCDTPADPNLLGIDCDRYVVDRDCIYTGTEVDANGDAFAPDTRNIMSYSRKACRQYFSAGQLDRVRFYLGTTRSYLTCPASVCESSDPDPTIVDKSMTTITIELVDNGQQSTALEYTVNGGAAINLTTTQPRITLDGFSPCDNVALRARNVCATGTGDWSISDEVSLDGCNLQYCPQPNNNISLNFSELSINNQPLQALATSDNYGVHSQVVTVNLDAGDPRLDLSLEAFGIGGNTPDSMYVQVWLDLNRDNEFWARERMLQLKVSTTEVFEAVIPIAASVSRNQQYRMRITASVESFIDPCDTEQGETEDVDVIFRGGFVSIDWLNDTIFLDAPAQTVAVPIAADTNWTLTQLPNWISSPDGIFGPSNATEINLEVDRNEGCDPLIATLLLTDTNGTTDSLVVVQRPASPGISVVVADTLTVIPFGGIVQFTSSSQHLYQVEGIEVWVNLFETGLIDSNVHLFSYQANRTDFDRTSDLIFEGCGEVETVVLYQQAGRTSWASTIDLQVQAVGDTIQIPVNSNTDWDVESNKSWLVPVSASGSRNNSASFVYLGNASSEEVAQVSLSADFGLIEGPTTVNVIAPFVSGIHQPRLSAKLLMANPITDRLSATTASAKTYQWFVQSSLGQQLHASFGESLDLDTTNWPAGTYFVKLEDEAGCMLIQRVVKF